RAWLHGETPRATRRSCRPSTCRTPIRPGCRKDGVDGRPEARDDRGAGDIPIVQLAHTLNDLLLRRRELRCDSAKRSGQCVSSPLDQRSILGAYRPSSRPCIASGRRVEPLGQQKQQFVADQTALHLNPKGGAYPVPAPATAAPAIGSWAAR